MKTEKYYISITNTGLMRWVILLVAAFSLLLVVNISTFAQGLLNNGATIVVNTNTMVIVKGGAGHITNQDAGASSGRLENNGTISLTGNWINNSALQAFPSSSGTVILDGASQTIGGLTSTWFNNLTLNGSGIKSLQVATLVGGGYSVPSGILNLNNLPLDLNQFTLTVNNPLPSAISRTTGYIVSETNVATNPSILKWNMMANTGAYVYPFGVNGTYLPLTITKNSAALGQIAVSTRATISNDNTPFASGVSNLYSATYGGSGAIPVVIDRWWNITSISPLTADLSFTYRGSENTTTYMPTGTFGAQRWSSSWLAPAGSGTGVTTGTGVVNATGQPITATAGDWVLSNTSAPLPIELISFEAICQEKKGVKISWSTASEINVDRFEVEISEDGIHYFHLGSVQAAGNSNSIRNYEFNAGTVSVTTFYKLREIDIDGFETTFSPAMVNKCNGSTSTEPSLYADGSGIKINAFSDGSVPCRVIFYDLAGRLISNKIYPLQEGMNQLVIFEGTIVAGIYMAKIEQDGKIYGKKIIIK